METIILAVSALAEDPALIRAILADQSLLMSILTDPGFADGYFGAATADAL